MSVFVFVHGSGGFVHGSGSFFPGSGGFVHGSGVFVLSKNRCPTSSDPQQKLGFPEVSYILEISTNSHCILGTEIPVPILAGKMVS